MKVNMKLFVDGKYCAEIESTFNQNKEHTKSELLKINDFLKIFITLKLKKGKNHNAPTS